MLLEMAGFGAFRRETIIDFEGVEFFALTGPTGSGKSTVIDAICFALYGTVPRYSDQRLVGAAMSAGAAEARVRLTFTVGDHRYVAVRVVRRSGGSGGKVSTKEARLERVEVDGSGSEVLAGRETEMRGAVESVVGLSFDDFTRCVVLPQGAFARFLHDKPADRQALLVRLLDIGIYQRLVGRANAIASDAQRRVDRIDGQLEELASASGPPETELRERIAGLDRLRPVLEAELRSVAEARTAAADSERRIAELDVDLETLRSVVAPPHIGEQQAREQALAERAEAAAERARQAAAALEVAEEERRSLPELSVLEHARTTHGRISKGTAVVAQLARETERTAEESERSRRAADVAASALEAAQAQLDAVRRQHLAHTLADGLQPGDECPVCATTLTASPRHEEPPGLEPAEEAVRRSTSSRQAAEREAQAAATQHADVNARHRAATQRLAELTEEVAAWPDPAVVDTTIEQVTAATRRIDQAPRRTTPRCARRGRAADALAEQRARAEQDAAALHRQRDAVIRFGPLVPDGDLASRWLRLARWAAERADDVTAARRRAPKRTHRELGARHRTRRRAPRRPDARRGRRGRGAACARPRTGPRRGATRARGRCGGTGRRPPVRARTPRPGTHRVRRVGSATEGRPVPAVAGRIDLRRDRRPSVDDPARSVEPAVLLDTSEAGEFVVVDTPPPTIVDPCALSGGETFQASLALALAVSEHVMELSATTGRTSLESIFLDEGFGTLDETSLDIVASTIEALRDDGRMVGIVTHIRELSDRVPVRFRVHKDASGASVVRDGS
ncbi:MAG: SMC family ATPase [Ilumatobacteraceae bacterium]